MTRNFGSRNSSRQQEQVQRIVAICLVLLVLFSGIGAVFLYASPDEQVAEEKSPPVEQQQAPTIFLEPEPDAELMPVLVTNMRLNVGSGVNPTMFRVESRSKEQVPPGAINSFKDVQGMFVKNTIPANQLVFGESLTANQPNSTITANIPEGFRAVTIRVDERTSVEGWARPGARVDIVWATELRGEKTVSVIVQNAKILSAERQALGVPAVGPDGQPIVGGVPTTVTLLVTAQDAAKIQLASTAGTLSLSLRGDRDSGSGEQTPSITLRDLLANGRSDSDKDNREGIIKIRKSNGRYEEFMLKNGKLVPVAE
jgi:pilus assembly protein CpaB